MPVPPACAAWPSLSQAHRVLHTFFSWGGPITYDWTTIYAEAMNATA